MNNLYARYYVNTAHATVRLITEFVGLIMAFVGNSNPLCKNTRFFAVNISLI